MTTNTGTPKSGTDELATVIVLAGGLSHEREISLRSGRRVAEALRSAGHTVIESDVNPGLVELVQTHPDAVVVPMLHGGVGEDGSLKSVLELLDARYLGSTAQVSRVAFNKAIATPLVAKAGVRTPQQVVLPEEVFRELGPAGLLEALVEKVGLPLMVKPARSGSALGATRVTRAEDLPAALMASFAYDSDTVIEEFVDGVEVAVAVLGSGEDARALETVEIRPQNGVYDYTARYTAGMTRFVMPAELPDEVRRACRDLALAAHRALGLTDLSRIDIIVTPDGDPVFLEAGVSPGMTETSMLPLAMSADGTQLGQVISELVQAHAG